MSWPAITLIVIAALLGAVNIWASVVALRSKELTPGKTAMQIAFVWLVPFIGAFTVYELFRRHTMPPENSSLSADEINPQVSAVLRPLAKTATRAAQLTLESAIVETITTDSSDSATESHDQ